MAKQQLSSTKRAANESVQNDKTVLLTIQVLQQSHMSQVERKENTKQQKDNFFSN